MAGNRRVGFIGLGIMGSRMAGTLLRAGYRLSSYDLDRAKTAALTAAGATDGIDAGEVAAQSDILCASLPNPAIVKSVFLGPEGVLERARPGTIVIDLSTVDPETSRAVHAAAAARDIAYLDAPVSGGFREAESGKLILIVGGERAAFDAAQDVLSTLGTVNYAGPSGAGSIVKLVNNVMSMGNVLVAAEAFVVGVKAGMDAKTLFEIIRTSGGRSFHFERRFPNLLARNFEPGFTVDLARKDLGLAVDMARSKDVPVPVMSLLHQLYNASSANGDGGNDFVSIVKLFEQWAGTEVRGE